MNWRAAVSFLVALIPGRRPDRHEVEPADLGTAFGLEASLCRGDSVWAATTAPQTFYRAGLRPDGSAQRALPTSQFTPSRFMT